MPNLPEMKRKVNHKCERCSWLITGVIFTPLGRDGPPCKIVRMSKLLTQHRHQKAMERLITNIMRLLN